MIATVQAAICAALGALPGVAVARPYAGELGGTQKATLQVPALLVALGRLAIEPDPGTGEVLARAYWSCFVCTRHAAGAEARGADAWDLAEAVLGAARLATWGVPGCGPATLEAVLPLWQLEERALAVREVRWTQTLRLGESQWTGEAVTPSVVYLGVAPEIGQAYLAAYQQVWPEATPDGGTE